MQRNRAKKVGELPPINNIVKAHMKQKRITQKQMARAMGCVPSSFGHLLKSTDWKISELLTVGKRLDENLLSHYLPPADTASLTELQTKLAETQKQLEESRLAQQQQANEINILNARLESLREALSLVGGK